LSKIYTHNDISVIKNIRLIYHSIVKYFSGLSLAIHWISTPSNLPPSSAGIGKTLNIANASEIMPANPKYNFRHHSSYNFSQNLIAHAGHVNLLSDVVILSLLSEIRSFHKVPSAENVSIVCVLISFVLIRIAVSNGNFIGLMSNAPA
jgi:hypothetical protein